MAEEVNETIEEVQQPIIITIDDLKHYIKLLDVAISRSAYRPLELESVGKLYKKLDSFVNAAEYQMKKSSQESEQDSEQNSEE